MNKEDQTELDLLREIAGSLHDLFGWVRVLGYARVTETLATALSSKQRRRVYEAMDGLRGVRDIQKSTGVNKRLVSAWGREWEQIGIVGQSRASDVKGRRQKLFDLASFGIALDDQGPKEQEG